MPEPVELRAVSDEDIANYSAYCAKLARVNGPDDPPPHRFAHWFENRYQAQPVDRLIGTPAWLALHRPPRR